MNNIVKTTKENYSSPLAGFVDTVLKNSFSRFFDDEHRGMIENSGHVPVNIRETGKTYEMEVVAPGLKKEDFHIDINKDLLTISFEHREDNKEERKEDGYLRTEYRMQSFSRSFRLDDTVDLNQISARYQDGILHMILPKKEGAQMISRRIEIK